MLPAIIICLVMFIFAMRSGLKRLYLHALLAALLAGLIFWQGYTLKLASVIT
jgi:hypothetical protein